MINMQGQFKVIYSVTLVAAICFSIGVRAQSQALTQRIQDKLDSFCVAGHFPGLAVGVVFPDGKAVAFASGMADSVRRIRMTAGARMMQGSVGKTYVSAIVMQLIKEGKFSLNDKISKYLGHYAWFSRLPNAADITIKMLMEHTSGIMRYEFKDAFTKDLSSNPGKVWKPEELLSYVFDEKATFKAGEGWDYADTNYIVLAMIMEQVTGQKYYDMLQSRILQPMHLTETGPSDKRKLPGLVQGYAGKDNPFGGHSEVIAADGEFIINPQFEWTGGGVYSTTLDLAKWGKLLYEGKAFDQAMLAVMEDGVPAKELGRNTNYGLGVIIRQSQKYGTFYGHSGFFPGYMTEMCYFPKYKVAFALQTNSSDYQTFKAWPLNVLVEIAKMVFESGELK